MNNQKPTKQKMMIKKINSFVKNLDDFSCSLIVGSNATNSEDLMSDVDFISFFKDFDDKKYDHDVYDFFKPFNILYQWTEVSSDKSIKAYKFLLEGFFLVELIMAHEKSNFRLFRPYTFLSGHLPTLKNRLVHEEPPRHLDFQPKDLDKTFPSEVLSAVIWWIRGHKQMALSHLKKILKAAEPLGH